MRPRRTLIVALAVALAAASTAGGAPLLSLDEQGTTFLYRARPGESPGAVAEMFGIAARDVQAFLEANRIVDPTHVGAGFVYRIPNAPARALTERVATLERDNARLAKEHAGLAAERDRLARETQQAQADAAEAEARVARSARLETLWPLLQALVVLLVIGLAAAIGVAGAAVGRQRRAERYARGLVAEAEEKRRVALLERQEAARRTLELETRVRNLEAQVGPRLLVGGRT